MGISVLAAARASMLYFLCSTGKNRLSLGCFRFRATTCTRLYHSNNNNNNQNNIISSTQSATVKKIRALLSNRKKRLEHGATVVEGPRPILDLLLSNSTRYLVQQVLIEQGDSWDTHYPALLERLLAESTSTRTNDDQDDSSSSSPMILPVTSEVMRSLSDTVTPQGIVGVVSIPKFNLQEQQQTRQQPPLFLVLDALSDPGNMGTLLRSSAAVGAAGVILLPGTTDPWNPKALRSSMGCAFYIPIYAAKSFSDALEMLDAMGCRKILAASMMLDDNDENDDDNSDDTSAEDTTSCWDVDWTEQAVALIIGNEGNGLSAEVRQAMMIQQQQHEQEHNTQHRFDIGAVHVPMQPGVESLNAGVCGSVVMFEYLRQCRLPILKQQQ